MFLDQHRNTWHKITNFSKIHSDTVLQEGGSDRANQEHMDGRATTLYGEGCELPARS